MLKNLLDNNVKSWYHGMMSEIRSNQNSPHDSTAEIPIALDKFIETMGITDTTAWRYRKRGWLETDNIAGRVYIYPDAIRKFNARVKSGEFAKEHVTPKRKKAETREDSSQSLSE